MQYRDKLLSYGIVFGKRFSKADKLKFLKAAQASFNQLKYKSQVLKSDLNMGRNNILPHYNLYTNNIQTADIVVATYYDTAQKNFLKKNIYAFSNNESKTNHVVHLIISLLLLLLLSMIGYWFIIPHLQNKGFLSLWGMISTLYVVLSFFIINRISRGIPNRYNFVKNTSSILAIFELAKLNNSKDISFALIDGGTNTNYGFKMLKEIVSKDSTIIYLDSIANEGKIVTYIQEELIEFGLNDYGMKNNSALFITSGFKNNGKVIINKANTIKDKTIDEKTLHNNVTHIHNLISKIRNK